MLTLEAATYEAYTAGHQAIAERYSAEWYAAKATPKAERKAHRAMLALARDVAREVHEAMFFPA